METWTQDVQGTWATWSHAALCIEAAADPGVTQVVVVGRDGHEDPAIVAVVRLVRRLASRSVDVVAASEHPSEAWYHAVRKAGATRAVLVTPPRSRATPPEPGLAKATDLGGTICPFLQAQVRGSVTLSVCGHGADRMVLARHHLDRWCLATNAQCPYLAGMAP